MRIGILTFHEICNPGAYLQAYATMKTLEEMGHETVIIDYTSPPHRFHPWRMLLLHPRVLAHFRYWYELHGRNRAFAECQKYLKKTPRFIARSQLSSERFDAVLVGADTVWNYQLERLGRDPIYFGEGLRTERLIAFAPSCGTLDLGLPIPEFVRNGLPRFHAIAVRDEKTADLVERVLGRRPEVMADPTFALSLEELPEVHVYEADYLLVYTIPGTVDAATQEAITEFARVKGLGTVAVCYRHDWVDENRVYANPFQWLGRIRCARYVFTGTFHGTIGALRMGKAFATQYNVYIEAKTRPMMEALGRQDRVCDHQTKLVDILETPWDVAATHKAMDAMADRAREYLKRALA